MDLGQYHNIVQEVCMIYEMALVARPEATDEQMASLKDMIAEIAGQYEGEVLLTDDWGRKQFAQVAKNGASHGHYVYFIIKGNNKLNDEINRRTKISDDVHKILLVKLSDIDAEAEEIVKKYKTPHSKAHNGSQTDELEKGGDKDRRRFSKRKNCWFKSNSISADWKDPKTFNWLVNEFGKIQPSRVSGISRKHHRYVESAIKRARNIGLASHLSGNLTE